MPAFPWFPCCVPLTRKIANFSAKHGPRHKSCGVAIVITCIHTSPGGKFFKIKKARACVSSTGFCFFCYARISKSLYIKIQLADYIQHFSSPIRYDHRLLKKLSYRTSQFELYQFSCDWDISNNIIWRSFSLISTKSTGSLNNILCLVLHMSNSDHIFGNISKKQRSIGLVLLI